VCHSKRKSLIFVGHVHHFSKKRGQSPIRVKYRNHILVVINHKEVENMSYGYGGGFALIVVLFILLIIVGASWVY
jgi:uncharacterized protein (TIGR01732 family)